MNRNMQDVYGFNNIPDTRQGAGGARKSVQNRAQDGGTSATQKVYNPPSIVMLDPGEDARYGEKDDAIENIYQPAAEKPAPRSGIAQVLSWLTTGVLR